MRFLYILSGIHWPCWKHVVQGCVSGPAVGYICSRWICALSGKLCSFQCTRWRQKDCQWSRDIFCLSHCYTHILISDLISYTWLMTDILMLYFRPMTDILMLCWFLSSSLWIWSSQCFIGCWLMFQCLWLLVRIQGHKIIVRSQDHNALHKQLGATMDCVLGVNDIYSFLFVGMCASSLLLDVCKVDKCHNHSCIHMYFYFSWLCFFFMLSCLISVNDQDYNIKIGKRLFLIWSGYVCAVGSNNTALCCCPKLPCCRCCCGHSLRNTCCSGYPCFLCTSSVCACSPLWFSLCCSWSISQSFLFSVIFSLQNCCCSLL